MALDRAPAAVVLRAAETVASVELRRYLQDQLASFKIPRRIVFRDRLPKKRSGKVQRWRLTESWQEMTTVEPKIAAPQSVGNTSVENAMTNEVRAIWVRLLKTAPLSLDDDFFEKGGDSLVATRGYDFRKGQADLVAATQCFWFEKLDHRGNWSVKAIQPPDPRAPRSIMK